jgi:hypothetical protein
MKKYKVTNILTGKFKSFDSMREIANHTECNASHIRIRMSNAHNNKFTVKSRKSKQTFKIEKIWKSYLNT